MSTYETAFATTMTPAAGTQASPPPLPADPELEWIEQARGGDTAAFERLYRSYVGRVFALCHRLLPDRGIAEEATQDAFVRAWDRLGSFRGDSAFGSWLHRLAANISIDRLRFERRRGFGDRGHEALVDSEDPDGAPVPASASQAPAREAGRDVHGLDLERAIHRLPPRARLVFVLHDVEGYKHHEISSLTGMAEGTSKAQLHRARKLLRQGLDS